MEINKTKSNYYDKIYDFEGRLGIHSQCGLKTVNKNGQQLNIVTELTGENPGTSITDWCEKLATELYSKSGLDDHNDFIYIEHTPNLDSKLSFYNEEFYRVNFQCNNGILENPQWEKVNEKYISELID